ncbi:hypothetical protein THOD04_50300 [Vibrio owensii]|nr:hypothetical protein THOD04_50300 [Vibrio owensii]
MLFLQTDYHYNFDYFFTFNSQLLVRISSIVDRCGQQYS